MSLASLYTTDFVALKDTDSVGEAAAHMLQHQVTDLPIVDASGRLMGLFKLDRVFASLLPKAALLGYGIQDLGFVGQTFDTLREHMREIDHEPVTAFAVKPQTISPEGSPLEVVLLLYRGANSVPVVQKDGKLVGMVSARDILAALHQNA